MLFTLTTKKHYRLTFCKLFGHLPITLVSPLTYKMTLTVEQKEFGRISVANQPTILSRPGNGLGLDIH